jgi:hypothetical protein
MGKILCSVILCLTLICGQVYAGSSTPSGLTAQDFITRIRVDMNASTAIDAFFTDADLIQWVNEAVEAIVGLTQCMEASTTITLNSGSASYPITAAHYDISHCMYDSGVSNSPTRFSFLARFTPGLPIPPQEERPKIWWEWESRLFIFPVPNDEISGTTIYAYYIPKHAAVNTSAIAIATPAYMDLAIVYYVRAKAHYKEKAEEKATYYMKMFNSIINEHKRTIIRRDLAPVNAPTQGGGQ